MMSSTWLFRATVITTIFLLIIISLQYTDRMNFNVGYSSARKPQIKPFNNTSSSSSSSRSSLLKPHGSVLIKNMHTGFLTKKYVVISASVPNFSNNTNFINNQGQAEGNTRAWGYIFQVPNTARAWIRLGYSPIVAITIDYPNLTAKAKSLLAIVEKEMKNIDVVAIYFSVPSYTKVRLSQLVRLIPSALNIFSEESFLMTSDADLWPGSQERYQISANKKIHITNNLCCGMINFKSKRYRQFPMGTIGMKVKLWNQLLPFQKFFTFDEFITFDYIEFYKYLKEYANGQNIDSPAKHGSNLWYIDQIFISVKIGEYINSMGEKSMSYYPRFKCRRIDVWNLSGMRLSMCFDDAHIYKDQPWLETHWNLMNTLMRCLHNTSTVEKMNSYAAKFRETYKKLENNMST